MSERHEPLIPPYPSDGPLYKQIGWWFAHADELFVLFIGVATALLVGKIARKLEAIRD